MKNKIELKIKNNKGITLIALVITIIVLLILAGVSISTLTGDNGILTQAQNASDQSKASEVEEKIELWRAEVTTYAAIKIGEESQKDTELLEDLINEGYITNEDINESEKTILVNDKLISYAYGEVNIPEISEGMIPIKWLTTEEDETLEEDTWVICSEDDPEWYNYINQEDGVDGTSMWANVMLSDGTYKEGSTATVGQTVTTTDLGSMFVWIPRYSYMISEENYHTSTAGTIEIKFLIGETNIAQDGTTNWDNESEGGNWNVHPAFTFGDEELTGFWMAKFESSEVSTEIVAIKPNVTAWTNQTISEQFLTALNMNKDEIYKLIESEVDTHLILNKEWGAVAYLTQSSYGRNEIDIDTNNQNKLTGGGNYIENTAQSTTGNVTGVYDLSGGAMERSAAYINNGNGSLEKYGQSLLDNKNTKYVEVYNMGITDSSENNYAELSNLYGNAIWETSLSYTERTSWYLNFSYCPNNENPFFKRGGSYGNDISDAGLFYFATHEGSSASAFGFRVVLAV